jgi:hypothetical protein
MQKMKIPEKLIKLTEMTMDNSRERISRTYGVTDEIVRERGVRQGDTLPPTLFNITLDGGIKVAGAQARDKRSLGAALKKLVKETEERGLQLNQNKSK